MHQHRHKTWSEAAGLPETSARLDKLPEGLCFPADFPETIHFDARRKHLVYRGFMTSVSYRFLRNQSADISYLDALDALFKASADASSGGRSNRRAWLWFVSAVVVGAAASVAWRLMRRRL